MKARYFVRSRFGDFGLIVPDGAVGESGAPIAARDAAALVLGRGFVRLYNPLADIAEGPEYIAPVAPGMHPDSNARRVDRFSTVAAAPTKSQRKHRGVNHR